MLRRNMNRGFAVMLDNLPRVLGGRRAVLDRESWSVPPLFRYLVEAGRVPRDEAHQAFNMGVGLVLVVEAERSDAVLADLRSRGEEPWVIGAVDEDGEGVVWKEDLAC
jgi:phosphoribosylformylglycinamidine cyclo-ligase